MTLRTRLQRLEEAAHREPAQAAVCHLTFEQRAQGLANIARRLASDGEPPEEAFARLREHARKCNGEPSGEQLPLYRRVGELLRADTMEQDP
jgi:hypothetical protein